MKEWKEVWWYRLEAEFPDLAREWLQPVMEEGDSKKKSLSPANVRSGSSLRASWKCSRCCGLISLRAPQTPSYKILTMLDFTSNY